VHLVLFFVYIVLIFSPWGKFSSLIYSPFPRAQTAEEALEAEPARCAPGPSTSGRAIGNRP
jgi:hypothetical protein